MTMSLASNQEALEDKLYFFRSPAAGTRTCVIFGHAGLFPSDKPYRLRAGTTMRYRVEHGKNLRTTPTQSIGAGRLGLSAPRHVVTGPAVIENYRMVKGVGSGWKDEEVSYRDVEAAMLANLRHMQANGGVWCPHVALVRRRFWLNGGKTMLLGDIIDTVQRHHPAINDFHYAGCRGEYVGSRAGEMALRFLFELVR